MECKKKFQNLSDFGSKEPFPFPIWSERGKKQIFFKINLANSTFRSLYGMKESYVFLQQVRLSCPYVVRKEESEVIFAKMHRSICTNSVREYNLNRQIKIRHSY